MVANKIQEIEFTDSMPEENHLSIQANYKPHSFLKYIVDAYQYPLLIRGI